MTSTIAIIEEYCNRNSVHLEKGDDKTTLKFILQGQNTALMGGIDIDEDSGHIGVYTFVYVNVPAKAKARIAELIVRINETVWLGGFQFDYDRGAIAYATSIILGKAPVDPEIIKHLLYANWYASDRYFPAISMVVFGEVSPKAAIEFISRQKRGHSKSKQTTKSSKVLSRQIGSIIRGTLN